MEQSHCMFGIEKMNDLMGKTKLNIGSGKGYDPAYLNVDVSDTFGEGRKFTPDLFCDMTLLEFPVDSFTEVKAFDCLDHIEYVDCLNLVPRIFKWLKPNGILDVHLPNLRTLSGVLSVKDTHHALVWLYGTDGEENFYASNKIRWSYSKEAMLHILEKTGFQVIHASDDCGGYAFRMMGVKR